VPQHSTAGAAQPELVGAFAEAVQERIRDHLQQKRPAYDWRTEHHVEGTPVDVAGVHDGHLVVVELEWRRADPADNTAKLFRHLAEGALSDRDRVDVFQAFTGYYDLQSGGVSSKRANAEFVGETAARAFERVRYRAVEVGLDPPKRGGDWPEGWEALADDTAATVARHLD
jgi:hypothetical protein